MTHHGRQHKSKCWVCNRNRHNCCCSIETCLAFCCNNNWHRFMSLKDCYFFCHVCSCSLGESRCTHNDHWFTRKVNVFLVLGNVTRNGLVAKFGKFDSHFICRNSVWTAAHNCPIPTRWCVLMSDCSDTAALSKDSFHRRWHVDE